MRKSPEIAVVTNLAPNHLDIHKDMDEYVESKKNIILHQNAFSKAVLNLDNDISDSFSSYVRGKLIKFSRKKNVENGAYLNGDTIVYNDYGKLTEIMNYKDIKIPGMHNVENYLAAISAVWGIVSVENIVKVAESFGGVEHRAEFVRELDGVKYYNDSIASSPTRTAIGTLSLYEKKIIIIAGGYDKNASYEEFIDAFPGRVKELILMGKTAPKIKAAAEAAGFTNITMASDMEECVATAWEKAQPGDVVLLSPACASWDMYDNFEQRGDHFRECAQKL
jgi:UDP-N-acetylmuramoylalanine--D-glutamate ligase